MMATRTHFHLTPDEARRRGEFHHRSAPPSVPAACDERGICPGIGDEDLDREHATLFTLIERLLKADAADTLLAHFDAMQDHAQRHFAAEDVDLRHMSAGNTECHLAEHAAVLKSLAEVRDVLLNAALQAPEKLALVRRLASQLIQWLPVHVQEMDGAVAKHRSHVRFGGATVQLVRRGNDQPEPITRKVDRCDLEQQESP